MDCLKDRDVIAQLFRMMAEHGRAEQLRELGVRRIGAFSDECL